MIYQNPKVELVLYTPNTKASGLHPVYLKVNYKGNRKYFNAGTDGVNPKVHNKPKPGEWDDSNKVFRCRGKSKCSNNNPCDACEKNEIQEDFIHDCNKALHDIKKNFPQFNWQEFNRVIKGKNLAPTGSVLSVFDMKIDEVDKGIKAKTAGVGTKSSLKNTRNAFVLYLESQGYEKDLSFTSIDYDFLTGFETYLRSSNRQVFVWMRNEDKFVKRPARKGLSTTSVGIYMRNLRTVWNLAKKKKLTQGLTYPFEYYTIKSGSPNKENYRHLTIDEIKKLIAYQGEIKDKAKHESLLLWLAMFFSNGCNMADLCRWIWDVHVKTISDGNFQVSFKRIKNRSRSKQLEANLNDPNLNEIIKFFTTKPNPSPYVFPVLQNAWVEKKGGLTDIQITSAYQTRNRKIIKHLREICKEVGIRNVGTIDVYTARHSWAVSEYQATKDVYRVSRKLLHTSIVTTQTYLESLGFEFDATVSKTSELVSFSLMQKSS